MTIYEEELCYWSHENQLWHRLEGKTVMISGATGLIGKCLIDLFMQHGNVKVIAMSRNETVAKERFSTYWNRDYFRYISSDVNKAIPECGYVDYIIHAASNTHPQLYSKDAVGTITSNVLGTKNLLDYGIFHKTQRFCFVSSVEIYGENRGDVEKFDESYLGYLDCNTLRAGYPEGKRVGEALCNAYKEAYGLDFVIPRLSRVYGPTMLKSDSKAASQFIKKAALGENIVLKSKGEQKYSYIFVTDAVAGILHSIIYGKSGEAYNVTDEESDITLKELAEKLAVIAGTQVVYELPEEGEKKGYSIATKAMLDVTKLRNLGWKARVHMKKGLLCTIGSL